MRSDPSDPPVTATSRRPAGTPSAARAASRPAADRSTARISGRTGLPVTVASGQVGAGEGDGAGAGEPAQQPVGGARHRVLLEHHQRDAGRRRRQPDRHRRVAADGHDDRRAHPPHQRPGRHRGPGQAPRRPDVADDLAHREPPDEAPARQLGQTEAGGGHHAGLDAAGAADVVDRRRVVAPLDQRPAQGQAGHQVAGGAAPGDDRPGRRRPGTRRRSAAGPVTPAAGRSPRPPGPTVTTTPGRSDGRRSAGCRRPPW